MGKTGWSLVVCTLLYWLVSLIVVFSHLKLSYPAITCRGYPPMHAADIVALFVAPAVVGLPAVFGTPRLRWLGLLVMTGGIMIIYAMAMSNHADTRPHIGHLAGMPGLLWYNGLEVAIITIILYGPLLAVLYFLERVGGDSFIFIARWAG